MTEPQGIPTNNAVPTGGGGSSVPLVGVVVLHWNDFEMTSSCLHSLSRSQYENQVIFVVDNGSVIPLTDQLEAATPNIHLIRSPENVGFAAGCNLGINAALKHGCEFVWLLNNDTVVAEDALGCLVAKALADPRAGLIGSTILDQDDPETINHVGAWVYPHRGLCIHLGQGDHFDPVQVQKSRAPGFVTGCSMLARAEMINEVGLLDEGYFLYWEDVDWCLRVKKQGWTITMAYDSLVYHKGSGGLGSGTPMKSYYLSRNSLRFVYRLYPLLLPLALFWWPRRHLVNHLYKGRFDHARMALRGVADGVRGWVLMPEQETVEGGGRRHRRVRLRR